MGDKQKFNYAYFGFGQRGGDGSCFRCGRRLSLHTGRGEGAEDGTASATSRQGLFLPFLLLQLIVDLLLPVDLRMEQNGS